MDKLEFNSPERAAYTANKLLEFVDRLRSYAGGGEPADLDQAKDKLAAIAEVSNSMISHVLDTHDQFMVGSIPAEAFENDAGGAPGWLLPSDAEQSIRRWRLRKNA